MILECYKCDNKLDSRKLGFSVFINRPENIVLCEKCLKDLQKIKNKACEAVVESFFYRPECNNLEES